MEKSMTHQRIRKFNTSEMYPGKGMDNDLCMAVRAGNRVFLRGQTGFDLDGNMTGVGDAAVQAENAMSCVRFCLKSQVPSWNMSAKSQSMSPTDLIVKKCMR